LAVSTLNVQALMNKADSSMRVESIGQLPPTCTT
jgi:hypothetical protein